jgi:ubiquinone/menaquinone biosynthesis C-methylase UbiE
MLNAELKTEADQVVHNGLIVDQFTRQAQVFAERNRVEESLPLMLQFSGVSASDTVLDVACGPGIIACAFAEVAEAVIGIDLTPAMLDEARALQAERSLRNVSWIEGDVTALPFADNSFSIVVTRYTFHHFLSPEAVLGEMARVCRPGGRVVVSDVTPEPAKSAAYDRFETLRDPSHTHALPLDTLRGFFARANLRQVEMESFRREMEFDFLLSSSYPNPGDAERMREMIEGDLGKDEMDLGAHVKDGKIYISFPVTVVAGEKNLQEG